MTPSQTTTSKSPYSMARIANAFFNWTRSILIGSPAEDSPSGNTGETGLVVITRAPSPPALGPPSASARPEVALIEECSAVGIAAAQSTAGIKKDSVLQTLSGMACAIVQKHLRQESSVEECRRKTERAARIDAEIEEAESDLAVASAEKLKTEAWLATHPPAPRPEFSQAFKGSAVTLITLSVAPALHDMFMSLGDSLLQWALAFSIGLSFGYFALSALTPGTGPTSDGPASPGRPPARLYDFANGLAISIFLGRLAFVHSLPGALLAGGGTLLELVVIRVVRSKSDSLAADIGNWTAADQIRAGVRAQALSAGSAAAQLAQHIASLNHEREAILGWIENERRLSDRKEMEALAVAALKGAYTHELLKLEGRQRRSFKEIA